MKKSKKQKRNFFLIYIFLPNFKLGKKVKKMLNPPPPNEVTMGKKRGKGY